MHSTKKTVAKKVKEKTQDDIPTKKQDERLKKSVHSVTTPRPFAQKSSTADIYLRQKSTLKLKPQNVTSKDKPSTSQMKSQSPSATPKEFKRTKRLPFSISVNSPIAKRRSQESIVKGSKESEVKIDKDRQRKNTRTLADHEVKVLNEVDNNSEMINLTKKLKAQAKAFYVDLNEQLKDKEPSEEDVSYEDDFESYESDFDSYHSSTNNEDSGSEKETEKQLKEESMLDSGTFDLRERSAKTIPMEFIIEDTEKRTSLTDEGFQDMSSSSAVSSMKTVHVEVLERPLFIDFTKSKENRRKRRIFEKLKQRAKDILSMVTLHQMSFSLFEMKPIPYELYMATFGRANYTQVAVQTFDDGITVEVQTDDIEHGNKWTQYPIKFTKNTVHFNNNIKMDCNDIEIKINNLMKHDQTDVKIDEDYKRNPLRIFLEQKDGAGDDKMMPYDMYISKTKCDYNVNKLRRFLKKYDSRITNILSRNNANSTNLITTKKYPFSSVYVSITHKELNKLTLLQGTKIIGIVFSETKCNLVITIHGNTEATLKSVLCLWDLNVAILEPIKVLIASKLVEIGRLRGTSDGIFVAALNDGTVHLWDLTEDANWNLDSGNTDLSKVTYGTKLRQSAYTSSATNLELSHTLDIIVGLEFVTGNTVILENGNKFLGQICVLLKRGIIVIYSIIQEKNRNNSHDMGKAFWSKIKMEKYQDINLSDYIVPNEIKLDFNLNKAKKRLIHRRQEKSINSCPKSAMTLDTSVARDENSNWETGILCNALKIVNYKNVDRYLVGKNCGEVLISRRIGGSINVERLYVTGDSSTVTVLEVSVLPYFLAATDTGTIHLCSLLEGRVLLTLDSRNSPSIPMEKYQTDSKGRYLGSVPAKRIDYDKSMDSQLTVSSLVWCQFDPFCIISTVNNRLDVWNLTQSDIHTYKVYEKTAKLCLGRDRNVALLTVDGEVEIHKINTQDNNIDVFEKYISLL